MGASSPRFRVWLVASLVAAMLLLSPIPARAAATCASVGVAVNITLASNDTVTISRTEAGTFSVLGTGLTATSCGGATVLNRDTVNITGTGGNESVTIDLSGGAFEPGVVDEPGTSDEIEFAVDLGAGSGDSLTISGSPQSDLMTMGGSGVNLNDADDIDLTTIGIKARTLSGLGGDDVLSAAGANSTGSALVSSVTINGGNDSDSIIGGDGADTLNGDADADVIVGGMGSDTESGGIDNDLFDEGAVANGSDSFAGGTGADRVSYAARSTSVAVTMDGAFDDGESGEGDNVATDMENADGGSGADTMLGNGFANVLTGGGGDDSLDGIVGADTLDAGDDDDTLVGGTGNDSLMGGDGTDAGDYGAATTAVIASLATATATGGAGSDVLSGIENLIGGSGADSLTGDGGPNVLNGGSNNDTLAGGPDDDTFTGGSGTDTADFSEAASAVDVNLVSGSATGEGSDILDGILNVIGGTGDDGLTGDTNA
ncbi:MAG TPA: calcium-binding protein, partial [Actinomycetota bacterium]|nr:calcium-binding protein [Actinomycetota bacterium]